MFTKGLALSLSFSITGVFVLLGGVIHFTKSKYTAGDLGTLAAQWLKSALPGFSFGSEAFLIFGIMTENVAWGDHVDVSITASCGDAGPMLLHVSPQPLER